MKATSSFLVSLTSATALVALLVPPVRAATVCDPGVARMVSAQGTVQVLRVGQTQPQPARLNETYCAGDRIQVGDKSRADIALVNQPVLRLDQNTLITLAGVKEERASIIDMARGALHFFSRLPRNLEVNTAFVNAGVEGTEGLIEVRADRTLITIFDGRVLAANAAGSLPVTGGQSAVAEKGKPPVLTVVVRPRDAVQWALYYPPVTYFRPSDFQGAEPWQGMVRNSLEAYIKGDYQRAFDALKGAPADVSDSRFYAYRAQLLLGVGRVDEAGPDLERALKLNPNYSDALALQSIVAVVQNDKERALNVAQKAVAADPKSATALVAQSYAQQANFNLEGALESLKQAVQVNPNDALAWARLAELHLSFARLNDALQAAQKAVALDPNLARTQTVLGFAYLTQVNTTEAKKAFEKSIGLDQADYLPRLGLGLAKIREGDLQTGGREIEIAASLNPNNSIVRSYLGKTYYEEKRIGLDSREYATAKELDPKDPTPWFYDSIAKQTTNRPVEALEDMEKAIELNDNRAVYRSQLLLDSDLAARSAALGRIYSDLGFQQLALVEGWKSVNIDPTNFSAHRLLADSYSVLPRHEIARVSELLQSQLLQPINITPVQPHLSEAKLGLLSASGPGALSFLEFNPLFNRNQVTFESSALAGENGTYSGEGLLSGIYNKASFSLGGFHFQTDGWRTNADQKDSIGNAFVQLELTPEASVQAEVRRRDTTTGDIQQKFFPEDFFRLLNREVDSYLIRLGGRYSLTPDSTLLGSFIYQNRQENLRQDEVFLFPGVFEKQKLNQDGVTLELQHLFRSELFTLTSGWGYADTNGPIRSSIGATFIPGLVIPEPTKDTRIRHFNAYVYSNINLIKNVTVTAGLSFDFLKGSSDVIPHGQEDQFNPKFGITWNPLPGTTLRATADRVLRRTLITEQTLEPTQVAGFNQFYDDFNSTKAWRYGGAVDQKFAENLYGGAEFSYRDKETPNIDFATNTLTRLSSTERLGRTYVFWTPHKWLALRAEYQYERFRFETPTLEQPSKLNTHRVPLGVGFFHPSGFSAALTGTYWNQGGTFLYTAAQPNPFNRFGRDQFWVLDAAINYRLPQRYGFITFGATNLTDQKFKFFNMDFNNPFIQPKRMLFGKITLAIP